jgi:class 3 adenylate cyclase
LLGHRRKMLRAINELAGTKAATLPPAAAPEPNQGLDAERRQVTVMFTDLVGSTALSAHMDPEDLREIISAYQKCVAETVRRSDGFVAKYMGDGVLVYFGYPKAHEDDAERAVRAGLELIAAVTGLETRASLQTRVGIATGLVVVGDLIGSGEAQERGIVGETPNLAARLQAIAEPDSLVIAESTRKQLGNLFELRDLGARDLKGLAGPARAWAVLWRSSIESRFEALRSGGTPLVGRAEEFELLLRRWQQVESGEGRVVVLTGEPGIGKSRVTAALQEHLQLDPHARLRQFCSPHHLSTPLHPWIGQFQRAARLTRDDTVEEKLKKLEAVLAQSNAPPEEIGFIAALLTTRTGPQTGADCRGMAAAAQLPTRGNPVAVKISGQPHRSPTQAAVTTMKIPSANTMVSTMTPMIRSPNRSSRCGTSAEPMPQGNISRATACNARMEINASLTGRITNHPPAMCDCSVPVLIRCQDSSARRSQLSHFGHWDAAIAHL